jgi:hypothetical protein
MPRRAKRHADNRPSSSEDNTGPANGEEKNRGPAESVALGVGSRRRLTDKGQERATQARLRGLLPVPPEVEAEVKRQEGKHPMAPEYRKTLRDRLTLEHYYLDVEVAFRRTPHGIEVLAAGLAQIAEFRGTATPEERLGVVYGVG